MCRHSTDLPGPCDSPLGSDPYRAVRSVLPIRSGTRKNATSTGQALGIQVAASPLRSRLAVPNPRRPRRRSCNHGSIGSDAIKGCSRADAFWHRLHSMARELTLRIVIEQPPAGVDFGLQKGRGNAYETVQTQRSQGKNLVFEFQPSIKDGVSNSMVALGGPFVQGPPRQRFVYIDIGTYAGQADSSWSRRLKIPLDGIPAKAIGAGGVLEARVPGTGRDGGPAAQQLMTSKAGSPSVSERPAVCRTRRSSLSGPEPTYGSNPAQEGS